MREDGNGDINESAEFSNANLGSELKWGLPSKEEYIKSINITEELVFNALSREENDKELANLKAASGDADLPESGVIWRMHFYAGGDHLRGWIEPEEFDEKMKNLKDFFRSMNEFKVQYEETDGFAGHAPQVIRGEASEGLRDVLLRSDLGFREVKQETEDDDVNVYHPNVPQLMEAIGESRFVKRYTRETASGDND